MSPRSLLRPILIGALACVASAARADLVRMPNGGEVRGLLQGDRKAPTVTLETLLGGRIVLDREQAVVVTRRSPQVEDYVTRSREIPDTVEAHWELAEWCRERRLLPQRDEQLEAIIELDPEHVLARRGLNHVRYEGRWMTRDESMRAQGYVKYKGKYLTKQEVALLDKTAAERESELAWYPKIRLWAGWVIKNIGNRRNEGLAQLRGVTDPDAIPALDEFLSDAEEAAWRRLLIERLAAMTGEKPVPSLVRVSLADADVYVRKAAFEAIKSDQYEKAVPYFVDALDDESNDIVQRAGTALGVVGDGKVVPALIRALITRHKVAVQVPVQETVSVARGSDGRYAVGGSQSTLPPNIELLLRTGQLPYGVQVIDPSIQYKTVMVWADLKNDRILESLRKLTQNDFGYDQDAWQLFWAARQSGVGRL